MTSNASSSSVLLSIVPLVLVRDNCNPLDIGSAVISLAARPLLACIRDAIWILFHTSWMGICIIF